MSGRIVLIVNPNSSHVVTRGIAAAVAPLEPAAGASFEVVDIPEGPATIATAADVHRAGQHVADLAARRTDIAALVIACFSDPGLELVRASTRIPVLGIQEAGILTALARADLFGIVALGPASVERHRLRIRQMGAWDRLAGELPLDNVSAEAAGTSEDAFAQALAAGRTLRDRGARALVLGCAGFAPRRRALEIELGIAVIDPVQAAAAMALAAILD